MPKSVQAGLPALLATIALSGCAATSPNSLPKYQPPPVDAVAAILAVGPHTHAWAIDGAETPSFADSLRLAPGEHRVGINCLTYEISGITFLPGVTPIVTPKTGLQFVLVTGSFEADKKYFSRCAAVDGQPRVWLAETPDGNELPKGFTSICTRECPP